MSHNIIFSTETETDAVFQCTICGEVIGFNKEGIGEPCASLIAGVWSAPSNFSDWMTPCTQD